MVACRWPNGSVNRPRVTSSFGPRKSPGGVGSTIHRGVDFNPIGQIRAIADGVVRIVGTPSGWSGGGRQVWIQHDGFFSKSMHMASYAVKNNQRVSMGEIIGAEGRTGAVTGVHHHLEVTLDNMHYRNSGQIDPVPFIAARLTQGSVAGGTGRGTEQLQIDLSTLGYPLVIDNDYGPAVKAAVTQFQIDYKIGVDGDAGPTTLAKVREVVTALQKDLVKVGYSLTPDGQSGPQTIGVIKDLQSKAGLVPDGIAGPQTRAALAAKLARPIGRNAIPEIRSTAEVQRLVGAVDDGVWGDETTAKTMAWQAAQGLTADGIWGLDSDKVGFPVKSVLDVDGDWGEDTWKAVQRSLGFTGEDVDGDPGVKTIRALQAAIGMPVADQDGELGPKTITYLQASVGVRQDGDLGVDTTTAVQTLMNAGGKLLPGTLTVTPEPPKPTPAQPAAPIFPGATRWGHSPKSSNRTGKVQLLIWHYWATFPVPSNDAEWNYFMRENDPNGSSPNLQINPDGTGYEVVPPDDYRAWTTGGIDHQAVTVEMGTVNGAPSWLFSDASLEMLAQYLAWAAVRYGFPIQKGLVGAGNVVIIPGLVGHNETPAGKGTGTACPGPAVDYDRVIARARVIATPIVPEIPEPGTTVVVQREWLENLRAELDASADEVGRALGGN